MTLSWCCAQTHEYCETMAAKSLADRTEGAVFLPRFYEVKLIRRKEVRRPAPLFPEYLFVQLDLTGSTWRKAVYAKGVARLLGPAEGTPSPIRKHVVEEIMARCDDDGFYLDGAKPMETGEVIRKGETVRVVDGPFSSFTGVCYLSKRERVGVLLNIFGREQQLHFRRDQVAHAA